MNSEKLPGGRSWIKTLAYLTLAFFVLMVIISGIIYLYTAPSREAGTKWNNNSFIPSSNVTLVILLNTTGPQQVTILDSDSGMATISMRSATWPQLYLGKNDDRLNVDIRLNQTYDRARVKADTYVYLPRGPDYHLTLIGRDLAIDGGRVINKYSGGNLTIRTIDLTNEQARYPGEYQ